MKAWPNKVSSIAYQNAIIYKIAILSFIIKKTCHLVITNYSIASHQNLIKNILWTCLNSFNHRSEKSCNIAEVPDKKSWEIGKFNKHLDMLYWLRFVLGFDNLNRFLFPKHFSRTEYIAQETNFTLIETALYLIKKKLVFV